MRKDLIKTVLGVVLVGLVIVATYLYGNHQTQVQKQKEQSLQQARSSTSQNQSQPAPASKPASKATAPVTQTPAQPQPSTMPQTGGVLSVLPILLMILAVRLYLRSRHWQADEVPQS